MIGSNQQARVDMIAAHILRFQEASLSHPQLKEDSHQCPINTVVLIQESHGVAPSVIRLNDTLLHYLPQVGVLHGSCHPLLVIDLFVNWRGKYCVRLQAKSSFLNIMIKELIRELLICACDVRTYSSRKASPKQRFLHPTNKTMRHPCVPQKLILLKTNNVDILTIFLC